jgi:hypothetical protein
MTVEGAHSRKITTHQDPLQVSKLQARVSPPALAWSWGTNQFPPPQASPDHLVIPQGVGGTRQSLHMAQDLGCVPWSTFKLVEGTLVASLICTTPNTFSLDSGPGDTLTTKTLKLPLTYPNHTSQGQPTMGRLYSYCVVCIGPQ